MPDQSKSRELLLARFRLTPAEARVAAGLAQGMKLSAIAEHYGISVQTARSQLKSVFDKTGTHSQVQLVALLVRNGF